MILGSIISGCGMEAVQGRTDIEISSVTADSRKPSSVARLMNSRAEL